ncbi:cyclin-J isoform X1 [Electrophorus electricus]|uniref:cyclin-J isoform X1 n=1 Tax=Electrophorus electricus TaxID=8005 RepID=UPI0015CFFF5B|nr:cyclin-J isoform X1 [Electrophorus electricus]
MFIGLLRCFAAKQTSHLLLNGGSFLWKNNLLTTHRFDICGLYEGFTVWRHPATFQPMELQGQWWKGQLAGDIYHALRCKELMLPVYKGQSPQLSLRRYFADLIAIVSNRFRLCPAARHLAVYLLDLFMDRYDISVHQLHMVALSCLLLASKFEDREDRVPKLETLNSLGCMSSMNLELTKQGLLHMELLLLETFHWNLYLPTAAHFIEYYLSIAVSETDLHDGWPMVCLEKSVLYMTKYADYFLEVSLQDHAFLRFAPSLVAAACVASSRVILRLSPTWPPRLQHLTGYTWEQLLPGVERLLIAHDSDVKEASKQERHVQQPSLQPGQASYPAQCPSVTIAQHVHRPTLQYTQQSCQPVRVSGQGPGTYLSHAASLQTSGSATQPQTLSVPLEAKMNMPNRSFQLTSVYPCAAACFDR